MFKKLLSFMPILFLIDGVKISQNKLLDESLERNLPTMIDSLENPLSVA